MKYATQENVRAIVLEAVDTILVGIENMGFAKIDDLKKIEKRIDILEAKEETHFRILKDEINGLKADLSQTASKKEVEDLRRQMSLS